MPAVWDGSSEGSFGAASLWDGSTEIPIGSAALWDGSTEVPISWISTPPTFGFVAAASVYGTTSTPGFTVPSGVVSTDLMILGVSSSNNAAVVTKTGLTALTGPTDTGSMQGEVLTGTGWTAGDSFALDSNANLNPSAIVAAWYRAVTSTGGTATAVKSGTVTTLVAPDVTDDSTGDLIVAIFLEKSGSNVVTTAPTVSGVTNRAWVPWASSAAGLPSAWVGDYSAPAAAKTITYPQSSANGLAIQLRLRP